VPDAELFVHRIVNAVRFRVETLGLGGERAACRLVYSESDGLSGLIVDRYADFVAVQFTSRALARFQSDLVDAIHRLVRPRGVYLRTERGVGELEGLLVQDGVLSGEAPTEPVLIVENGCEFWVDIQSGQKTGGFLDQRENRAALCRYARGRSVLDVFCYTGGFGIQAATVGGATEVLGIDVSATALVLARRNAERNGVSATFAQEQAVPAMKRLIGENRRFGVVVCDPPKFARSAAAIDRALSGYDQINRLALELLAPGGILLTCSCSGHVSQEDFTGMLVHAAQKTSVSIAILEQRGQAPDHPVSAFCLETAYLKCIIARRLED
jgi:23S rRNA (cytosine1962-C5)-methyltransferase